MTEGEKMLKAMIEYHFKNKKYTWDELYELAENCACGSPELKAKDTARWLVECRMKEHGVDLSSIECMEDA